MTRSIFNSVARSVYITLLPTTIYAWSRNQNHLPPPAPSASSACRQVLSIRNENQAITLEIPFLFCRPAAVWAGPRRRFHLTNRLRPSYQITQLLNNVSFPYPPRLSHLETPISTRCGQLDLRIQYWVGNIATPLVSPAIYNEKTGLWSISTRYSSTSINTQSIDSRRIPKKKNSFWEKLFREIMMHRVLIYHTEPMSRVRNWSCSGGKDMGHMTMANVPGFCFAPPCSSFITLLVLGVLGAGFVEESWWIAVVGRV